MTPAGNFRFRPLPEVPGFSPVVATAYAAPKTRVTIIFESGIAAVIRGSEPYPFTGPTTPTRFVVASWQVRPATSGAAPAASVIRHAC